MDEAKEKDFVCPKCGAQYSKEYESRYCLYCDTFLQEEKEEKADNSQQKEEKENQQEENVINADYSDVEKNEQKHKSRFTPKKITAIITLVISLILIFGGSTKKTEYDKYREKLINEWLNEPFVSEYIKDPAIKEIFEETGPSESTEIMRAIYISIGTLIFCISILVIASENQRINEKEEQEMKKDGK